jgi:hypothetical protein
MATPYNQVSHDAAQALTEFSSAFDKAFSTVDPESTWARQYGYVHNSASIKTTFPIPLDAAGYHEFKGDHKYRRLGARSLSMKTKTWQDGVEEFSKVIEAPDFIGWGQAPANMGREATRHPMKLVAALLKANPFLDLYKVEEDGGWVSASAIRWFADAHPVNVLDDSFGTFDNDQSAVKIGADMISAAKLRFRQRLAPNGTPGGYVLDTLLVPAVLEEQAKDFFESDTLVLAVENAGGTIVGGVPRNNRHKGSVNLVVCPELLDANVVYAIDSQAAASPWILQDTGAPTEIRFDKDSEYWKHTQKVALSYLLEMAVAACLPHAIERITLTG